MSNLESHSNGSLGNNEQDRKALEDRMYELIRKTELAGARRLDISKEKKILEAELKKQIKKEQSEKKKKINERAKKIARIRRKRAALNAINKAKAAFVDKNEKTQSDFGAGREALTRAEKNIQDLKTKIEQYLVQTNNPDLAVLSSMQSEINNLVDSVEILAQKHNFDVPKNILNEKNYYEEKIKNLSLKKAHLENKLDESVDTEEIARLRSKLGISEELPKEDLKENKNLAEVKFDENEDLDSDTKIDWKNLLDGTGAKRFSEDKNKSNTENNSEKKEKDFDIYMRECSKRGLGHLIGQVEKNIPDFNNLTDAQKMLVIEGMSSEMLKHVRSNAEADFDKKISKQNFLGKSFAWTGRHFGGFMNNLGNVPHAIRKSFLIADDEKNYIKALKSNDPRMDDYQKNFLQNKVKSLVEVYGKYDVGAHLDKKGNVVADFIDGKDFENAPTVLQESIKSYNEMANVLSRLPKDSPEYESTRENFQNAKGKLLIGMDKYFAEQSLPNSKFLASSFVGQNECLMQLMNFTASDPQVAKKLDAIANNPAYLEAFKKTWQERGVVTLKTSGARSAIAASAIIASTLLATPATPVIGAIALGTYIGGIAIGRWAGRMRGEKAAKNTMEKTKNAAREGVSRLNLKNLRASLESEKNDLKNAKNDFERKVANARIGEIEKQIVLASKGIDSVSFSGIEKNLNRLSDKKIETILNETSPIKKQLMLSELKTTLNYILQKVERQEINYGSGDQVFVNQEKLFSAIYKSQTLIDLEHSDDKIAEVFSSGLTTREDDNLLQDAVNRRKKILNYGSLRAQRIVKEEKEYQTILGKKAAFRGGLIAAVVPGLRYLGHEVGWLVTDHSGVVAHDVVAQHHNMDQALNNNNNVNNAINHNQVSGANLKKAISESLHKNNHQLKNLNPKPEIKAPENSVNTKVDISGEDIKSFKFTSSQIEGIKNHTNSEIEKAYSGLDKDHFVDGFLKSTNANSFMNFGKERLSMSEAVAIYDKIDFLQKKLGEHPLPNENIYDYYNRLIDVDSHAEVIYDMRKGIDLFPEVKTHEYFDHIPSVKEVNEFEPTNDEKGILDKMVNTLYSRDVENFFHGRHTGLLHRSAERFFKRDIEDIDISGRKNLYESMHKYFDETGDSPSSDDTVSDYLKRMETFYSKRDMMQGNFPREVSPNNINQAVGNDISGEKPVIETNLNSGSNFTQDNQNFVSSPEEFKPLGGISSDDYELSSIKHMSDFSPNERAWAQITDDSGVSNAQKILSSPDLMSVANEHMKRELDKIFGGQNNSESLWSEYKNLSAKDIIDGNIKNTTKEFEKLREILIKFKEMDSQFIQDKPNIRIDDFMRNVYVSDEFARRIREGATEAI